VRITILKPGKLSGGDRARPKNARESCQSGTEDCGRSEGSIRDVVARPRGATERWALLPSLGMCDIWTKVEAISTAVGALATFGLAALAVPNLRFLRKYVTDTNEMRQEQLRQGVASRRPFVSIVPDSERVWLINSGPGIAFKATWQFTHHEKFGGYVKAEPVGAIGVDREVPLSFRADKFRPLTLEDVGSQDGLRIDYEDSSGKHYWSTIMRTPEGHTVVDSGEG
jgi:hypothetical protein